MILRLVPPNQDENEEELRAREEEYQWQVKRWGRGSRGLERAEFSNIGIVTKRRTARGDQGELFHCR
jgi:hypothetical protein